MATPGSIEAYVLEVSNTRSTYVERESACGAPKPRGLGARRLQVVYIVLRGECRCNICRARRQAAGKNCSCYCMVR